MLVSTVINKGYSKYGPLDYFSALLLCAGAAGYGIGETTSNSKHDDRETNIYGVALLSISVLCDALVPNIQQKLMERQSNKKNASSSIPKNPIAKNMDSARHGLSASALMVNVNFIGFTTVFFFMLFSGSLNGAFKAVLEKPEFLLYLIVVGFGMSVSFQKCNLFHNTLAMSKELFFSYP